MNIKLWVNYKRREEKDFPTITYFMKESCGYSEKIISIEGKRAHSNDAMSKKQSDPPKSKRREKTKKDAHIPPPESKNHLKRRPRIVVKSENSKRLSKSVKGWFENLAMSLM